MHYELKTIGHATLIVLENGLPIVATDPWLIGSVYWRSWWLERYPSGEEIDLVRRARHLYLTHSHPDHFHWPTLRHLGPRSILHARFPRYDTAEFLAAHGYPPRALEPWVWYSVTKNVRMASIPVPIDDSILVIDTPPATIVNLNDSVPRRALLRYLRRRLLSPAKPVVVLKSYAPASPAASIFRNGQRELMKTKQDYVSTARHMAEALGATDFIPFASQAFFSRRDSRWANEFKVVYEDLRHYWDSSVRLCEPFVSMNLATREFVSRYAEVKRALGPEAAMKVEARESEEAGFQLPADFDARLERYLREIYGLRWLLPHGIGWKLSTSGAERYYSPRTRTVSQQIPERSDIVITLPDKVLDESLRNNVLTDLGITMFIRVDTQISKRFAYAIFLMFGLHDYGHFNDPASVLRFLRFYAPYFVPGLWRVRDVFARARSVADPVSAYPL
jgi:hypothetical protein